MRLRWWALAALLFVAACGGNPIPGAPTVTTTPMVTVEPWDEYHCETMIGDPPEYPREIICGIPNNTDERP